MATFGNDDILIKIDELPIINGICIESIYKKQYDTRGVKDYTVRPEDAFTYYALYPHFSSDPIQCTTKLPKEIAILFDEVQTAEYKPDDTGKINKKSIKATSLWYRTSSSGNGSFIDQSICLNGSSDSISYTRGIKNRTWGIDDNSEMAKKLLATLKIKATVELCKEWEYTYYPCTTLRRVDGLNYPDTVCDGWRWSHGMPYVTLDNGKSLRVFNEKINAHVFLLKVEPEEIEIGEEYVIVDFSSDYMKSQYFCNIRSWADYHKEDPNGMLHYRVDKINKKERLAECTVMGQVKQFSNEIYYLDSFYRIARLRNAVNVE